MDYGAKIGFSLQLSNFSNKNRLRHQILPPKQAEDGDFPNWFCFDYASIKTNFRSFVAVLFGRLWRICSVVCGNLLDSHLVKQASAD